MNTLINAVLNNYVPIIIIAAFIVGIFVVAIAGVIRNSGKLEDVARSNLAIKTVIVGLLMLFLSGSFVFAFHEVYVSRYYGGIESQLAAKLSPANTSDTGQLQSQISQTGTDAPPSQCISLLINPLDCIKLTINQTIAVFISIPVRPQAGLLILL